MHKAAIALFRTSGLHHYQQHCLSTIVHRRCSQILCNVHQVYIRVYEKPIEALTLSVQRVLRHFLEISYLVTNLTQNFTF